MASPLLEKSASVLKTAIDISRQDAIAQWMSQVADQLNVIQQATLSLNTSIRTNASKSPLSLNPVIGDVSALQPTPVIVQLVQKQQNNTYDTYISYNQADRKEVMDIAEQLKARGILPWLDVQEVRPGSVSLRIQEAQIRTIPAAAIFVGQHGIINEQELETHSFIKQFIKRNIPVIPVILSSAPEDPDLPPFLDSFFAVNFHYPMPEPMRQLAWGITGERS